jgi:hypothetical protein
MLTSIGEKKYTAWLMYCESIGYKGKQLVFLGELWRKHHDKNSNNVRV